MKKSLKYVSLALIFALALTFGSCKKNDIRDIDAEEDDDPVYKVEQDETEDPVVVNDPSDPGNYDFDRSSLVETIGLAESFMGSDPVTFSDAMYDIYAFSGSYFVNDYYEGSISFMGDGFDLDGAFIKSIHFYLKDYSIIELDYCITEAQYLSMGAKESDDISSDLNLPAEDAYKSVCEVLEKKYGKSEMCDTAWMKADKAESQKWNAGNVVVAVTWGENCFGIPGNNQMEIAISADPDFVPGCNAIFPTSDVLDPELAGIIEFTESCFGNDQDTVKKMIEEYLNIELKDGEKLTEDYDDTVEYLYEGLDFSIAEVKYNEISIISNPDSGKVFDIIYWNLNVTPEQEQYDYELYYHKFSSYYGKLETYFFSDSSSVKLESNTEIIFGGSHETYDSYFNFVIQNEDYNS